MLVNRVTGEEREVDVVIRSTIAGQSVTIGIEATMRKSDSPWVEQTIGKHVDLPTDRLVLVAEKGFSKPARRYAEHKSVALIAPEQIGGDDPAARLVAELQRVWPKGVALTPDACWALVRKPDGSDVRVLELWPDATVFLRDGTEVMQVNSLFTKTLQEGFAEAAEQIGLAEITEDRDEFFKFQIGRRGASLRFRFHGRVGPMYLRWEQSDPPEFHEVILVHFSGRAVITVSEIEMTFRRFDNSLVGHGEGSIAGRNALFVISGAGTVATMSVRLRDEGAEKPTDEGDIDGVSYADTRPRD